MEYTKTTSLIRDIEEQLRPTLHDASLCEQYAWWTLCAITGKKKINLMVQESIELTPPQQTILASWIDRMVNERMPIQYLLGSVPFGDIDILVEPPILIPRPETEEWTMNLIDRLKKLSNQSINILDICSGTGCIALALGHALPDANIIALDISAQAIALGHKNARHNKITNVTFVQSDLFDQVATATLFDLVVSNPPYISFDEFSQMDDSVTTWEDPQALVADDDGRAILDAIIDQAPDYLRHNDQMAALDIPHLMLEIGYTQGAKIADFMKSNGFIDVQILKDLEGKQRVVCGRVSNAITTIKHD